MFPAAHPGISDAMSRDLLGRGFKFVGSTICYAFMQAVGLVNDHTVIAFGTRRWLLQLALNDDEKWTASTGTVTDLIVRPDAILMRLWRRHRFGVSGDQRHAGRGAVVTCWREFEAVTEFSKSHVGSLQHDLAGACRCIERSPRDRLNSDPSHAAVARRTSRGRDLTCGSGLRVGQALDVSSLAPRPEVRPPLPIAMIRLAALRVSAESALRLFASTVVKGHEPLAWAVEALVTHRAPDQTRRKIAVLGASQVSRARVL